VPAVETIDPSSHKASLVWDLTSGVAKPYFMNGSVTGASSDLAFFANVERQESPGKFVQKVVRFDAASKDAVEVYTFRPYSGGFWATFFDRTSERLYVGDVGNGGSIGSLMIIQMQDKSPTLLQEIPLDGVPYSGAFHYPETAALAP
jgi:hypothetical protein